MRSIRKHGRHLWIVRALVISPRFGLAILLGLSFFGFAHRGSAGDQPIDRLGSDRFSDRQSAMHRLWASPEEARQAVERAEREGDAEMAARARWILRQWQRGLTPQTPPDVRRSLLALADDSEPDTLLELACEGIPDPLLNRVREGDARTIEATAEAFDQSFLRLAVSLIRANRTEVLEELLDRCAATPEHAVLRSELLRNLGRPPADVRSLPSASRNWTLMSRRTAEVWLAELVGDHAGALELSRQYGLPMLAAGLMIARDEWKELASFAAEQGGQGQDQYGWWTLAMCAARYSDQGDVYDRALEQARQASPESFAAASAAIGLVLAGESDRAARLFSTTAKDDVVQLWIYQHRYRDAFESMGITVDRIDTDVIKLADQAKHAVQSRDPDRFTKLIEALQAAQLAYLVGHRLTARDAFMRLSKIQLGTDQSTLGSIFDYLPYSATDWRVDLAATHLSGSRLQYTLDALTRDANESTSWEVSSLAWQALEEIFPGETVQRRARALIALSRNELPDGWDRFATLDRFAETTLAILDRTPPGQSNREFSGNAVQLVTLFTELGRSDLAGVFRQHADLPFWELDSAEEALKSGAYKEAAELFRVQFTQGIDEPGKALVGWLAALKGQGAADEARELEQVLEIVPMTAEMHFELSQVYAEWGYADHASEHLEASWRLVEPASAMALDIAYRTGRTERERPELSYRWMQRALLACLARFELAKPNMVPRVMLMAVSTAVATARFHVLKDDIVEASRWLSWIQKLHPLEVDLAEHVTPLLREKGHDLLADRIIKTITDAAEQQLRDFPNDPTTCNNLAWALALNDRQLERALELSSIAVRGDPESIAYRDTLSETLFRLKRIDEAIIVERDCLIDTPDDWHLHKQLRRFEAARANR